MQYSQTDGPFRPLLNIDTTIKLETDVPVRADKLIMVSNNIDGIDILSYDSDGKMYDITLNSDRVSLEAIHDLVEGLKDENVVIDGSHLAVRGRIDMKTRFLNRDSNLRGMAIDPTINLEIPAHDRGVAKDLMTFQKLTGTEYNISESGNSHVVSPIDRYGFVIANEGSKPHWEIASQLGVDRENMIYQAMALGRRWNPDRL